MDIQNIKGFVLGDYGNNDIIFTEHVAYGNVSLIVKVKDQHYISRTSKHYKLFYKISLGREELTSNLAFQSDTDDDAIGYINKVIIPKVNALLGTHFKVEFND